MKKKVSDKDVKNAQAILDTAAKQKLKDSKSEYIEAVKALESLRKEKDAIVKKVDALVTRVKDKAAKKLERLELKIAKAVAVKNSLAIKAGSISELTEVKRPSSSKPKKVKPAVVEETEEDDSEETEEDDSEETEEDDSEETEEDDSEETEEDDSEETEEDDSEETEEDDSEETPPAKSSKSPKSKSSKSLKSKS